MRTNYFERIVGTTFMGTMVASGTNPSQVTSLLKDKTDTVVGSFAGISSGNGAYYSLHQLPNTPTPLVNEWQVWINSYQYIDRQIIKLIDLQVD